MKLLTLSLAAWLAVAWLPSAQAPRAAGTAIPRQVALAAAGVVEELFVDVLQGQAVAADLRRQAQDGVFDLMAPGPEFAATLTGAMQEVENDKHLNVQFKAGQEGPVFTAAEALERFRASQKSGAGVSPFGTAEEQRQANYDVKAARHLAGNVGYLELTAFQAAPEAREVIAAAMRMLENVDAMIVDMRGNRGGSQQTVNYLASYFFPAGQRDLISMRSRTMAAPMISGTVPTPTRKFENVPLYILTSGKSFSAGEAFPFIMQQYGRATIVGETTPGGGRPNAFVNLGAGFMLSVSVAAVTHPKTGQGWDKTGVVPDVKVLAVDALDAAHRLAREKLER
jgi:hypothetical protein